MEGDPDGLEEDGSMKPVFRRWWSNCFAPGDGSALGDQEIAAIDALEDAIAPLDEQTAHIRQMIATFEACHHKAERHAEFIIEAIGTGHSDKGRKRRERGNETPREREYAALLEALRSWCDGTAVSVEGRVGRHTAAELTALLGERTTLKAWQVERIAEKVSQFLDPEKRWTDAAYAPVVDGVDEEGDAEQYREATKRTVIHDVEDGRKAEISLAAAIDLLTGCNWDFPETVRTLLHAIGGQLWPSRPLALHARNIKRNPARERMRIVCNSLQCFRDGNASIGETDAVVVEALGATTPEKRWLAASLDKTVRLHLGL